MAQGSKKKYTKKQKRRASKIERSVKKSGKSDKTAARIAFATINKEEGGGKKSGSGRGKKVNRSASKKGGKKGGKKSSSKKSSSKKSSSKKKSSKKKTSKKK